MIEPEAAIGFLRLVVGLGNPGARFTRTRHNVGFRLVDQLAGDAPWRDFEGLGHVCRQGDLWLAKPMTYMNDSGSFIGALSRWRKIPPGQILVCFDDVALPLGRLRLRIKGSGGGQKGMESTLQHLGTKDVPRLRIGVGPQPPGMDSADYVLSRFSSEEEKLLATVLDDAVAAVRVASESGLDAAMNRFNAPPKTEEAPG
ncbi:MAG: aminoacyl-tRNA hydrolase [Elusimicrobia bacterium]|nr:aminoacyl-tRNA hydrolase [Elusimicrobiota bacterium]